MAGRRSVLPDPDGDIGVCDIFSFLVYAQLGVS
jgi:hypothetical protein